MSGDESREMVVRFSVASRLEHLGVILFFVLLLLTGLPQKWPHLEISRWVVDLGGGIFAVRFVHRLVGYLFAGLAVIHFTRVITAVITRRCPPSLLFTRQDFHDAIESLRYYLGGREDPPAYPKFDYRQKFEYWGLAFGSTVMVITGLILLYPVAFSRVFPADLIPASKVAHSNEALLALLVIIVWHAYTAHLSPDVFPFDSSIFTGKISKARLEEEHRLEFEERFPDE